MKKKPSRLNLKNRPVFLDLKEEEGLSYFKLADFSETARRGRNSFLIDVKPGFFETNSEIKIECLDANGNNVLVELPKSVDEPTWKHGWEENGMKRISITVNRTTNEGFGELIFCGKLKKYETKKGTLAEIPKEWSNVTNVRWTKKIFIDKKNETKSKILFWKTPFLETKELFEKSILINKKPLLNLNFPTHEIEYDEIEEEDLTELESDPWAPSIEDGEKNFQKTDHMSFESFKDERMGGGHSDFFGRLTLRDDPASLNGRRYVIRLKNLSGFSFEPVHLGAKITLKNMTLPAGSSEEEWLTDFPLSGKEHEASILSITNDREAEIDRPLTITSTDLKRKRSYKKVICGGFSISFREAPERVESDKFSSFIKARIDHLKTFSGKVDRIKLYCKSESFPTESDFDLLADAKVEPVELLTWKGIAGDRRGVRIGVFDENFDVNEHWETGSFSLKTGNPLLPINIEKIKFPLINGLKVTFGNFYAPKVLSIGYLMMKRDDVFFKKNNYYALEFNLMFDQNHFDDGEEFFVLDIFAKGNAFKKNIFPLENDYDDFGGFFGKRIARIIERRNSNVNGYQKCGKTVRKKVIFEADEDGWGRIIFCSKKSAMIVSDISIKSYAEKGFNPDEFEIFVTSKTNLRRENVVYKAEFYSADGLKHEKTIYSKPSFFKGDSFYIEGWDNLLTGSVMIGNALGRGVEMHGGNSALIKSVGWRGWGHGMVGSGSGFMLWSGSVKPWKPSPFSSEMDDLPTSLKNDAWYGDVGIELLGKNEKYGLSYLRFRTNPQGENPNLDIRGSIRATDGGIEKNFYVGTGSDSIHISSSATIFDGSDVYDMVSLIKSRNFNHLNPRNDGWGILGNGIAYLSNAIVRGRLEAQTGSIGGWEIKNDGIISPLYSGNRISLLSIDGSKATIKIGATASFHSGSGVYMDSDGNFRIGATTNDKELKFDSNNDQLTIKTDKFYLKTDGLIIDPEKILGKKNIEIECKIADKDFNASDETLNSFGYNFYEENQNFISALE